MNLTLKIWRQVSPVKKGKMVSYHVTDVSPDMSFLEMLDVLNEKLILDGDDPIAFDHDCREGICGSCGLMINGTRTPASFHRELGKLMWDLCGMERSEESLRKALDRIPEIRQEFWTNLKVTGTEASFNQTLEHAGRVADFIELAELMCVDALHRNESCGGHFRAESQTPEGEALRDDENFAYVAAWEYGPEGPVLHKERLEYEYVKMSQRSYK